MTLILKKIFYPERLLYALAGAGADVPAPVLVFWHPVPVFRLGSRCLCSGIGVANRPEPEPLARAGGAFEVTGLRTVKSILQ